MAKQFKVVSAITGLEQTVTEEQLKTLEANGFKVKSRKEVVAAKAPAEVKATDTTKK